MENVSQHVRKKQKNSDRPKMESLEKQTNWDRAKAETLEKQRKRREQEPLWYCKLITRHPRTAFGITLGLHLSMVVLTGILYAIGYDIIPVYMDELPVNLRNEPWQARAFAWLEKNKFPEHYVRIGSDADQTQGSPFGNIDIHYESKGDSTVFTKDTFLKIKQLEDELMDASGFEAWCRIDISTRSCTPPTSILRYFDGTYAAIDPVFNDVEYNNINAVLYKAYTHPDTAVKFKYFLGTDHSITQTLSFSSITRSVIQFGFPLKMYDDDELGYRRDAGEWTHEEMESVLEDFKSDNEDTLDVSYRSQVLWYNFGSTQAFIDCFWAGGSMGFIFLVVLFHTRSLWLAGFSVFSVMTGFLITNLIYNIVLGFKYLGFSHILLLFIILGIGADNFFVFYDTWRNTIVYKYPTLAHRVSDTYRKASIGMLFTSLTTAIVFYVNAITPVLATRSFGVFAGTAVVVNYLSVIIYFPTVVVMYHTYFERFRWPCCSCCTNTSDNVSNSEESSDRQIPDNKTTINSDLVGQDNMYTGRIIDTPGGQGNVFHVRAAFIRVDMTNRENGRYVPANYQTNSPWQSRFLTYDGSTPLKPGRTFYQQNMLKDRNGMYHDSKASSPSRQLVANQKKKPLMSRFFGGHYFKLITHKYARWILLLLMAGVLAFFIHEVTKLVPENEEFQLLPDNHVYEISRVRKLNSFVSSYGDETLQLYIVWGILQNDMSGCAFTAPQCNGERVYDNTFDINTPESQQAMKTFCETLENMNDVRAEKMRLRKNTFTGKYEIRCFLQSLEDFLSAESTTTNDLRVPFTKDKVIQFMKDRPQFYNASMFDDGFKDYLQIPISYWLSQKNTFAVTDDFYDFDPLVGEGKHNYSVNVKGFTDKYYGNFIKYVAVQVNTTIQFRVLGYEEGLPIRDSWEEFMAEEMVKMPVGLKNGFQTETLFMWHFRTVEKKLVQNAIYGLIIGLSVSLPLLIIATGNFIVGTLATFSLCCCTICIIGVIPLGGWKLGLLESLNMCVVVGLSVDYVVHLSQSYSHSLHADRKSRVKDMLEEMGTSVLFGAITSLGAAMFMFFTVITFFNQFATFMFSTIGLSLLFSLVMFTTLIGIIGPQNETGSLEALFRRCRVGSSSNETKGHPLR